MNIYKISQNHRYGYNVYDSAVVIAKNENIARKMQPGGSEKYDSGWPTWVEPKYVEVELIGVSKGKEPRVVLASFNAG